MKKLLLALLLASPAAFAVPTAISKTEVTYWENVKIGMASRAESYHAFTISNDTALNKEYSVTITLCAANQSLHCMHQTTQYTVAPGKWITKEMRLNTGFMFQVPGDHVIDASTEITGASYSKTADSKNVNVHF